MAFNLQSLSITSAFNSIVSFFKSQENNSKWRDLTNGSEGTFLIRLLANIISTLSYRIVAQSRENYLSTASLTSSNVGIAVNLGYSAFRGTNLKRLIYFTPDGNYTLPKFSIIGAYNSQYSILTLNDVELKEGVQTKIETVVGNLREESFVTGTSDIKVFTLFTTGISEDYILLEDGVEVPTTNVIKNLTEDKFLVRTNPYSSVDVIYLNTFESARYKYGTGTEFTVRYVELANMEVVPYTGSMFYYGTLDDTVNISSYLPFESVETLKVNAPLDHETQNLIRSKKDYANRIQQIIPSVIEANYQPLTPTYTQITYLKEDGTLLTGSKVYVGTGHENEERLQNTEVGQVLGILENENYFGTPLPDIVAPRREVAKLNISIALNNKYKNISDINLDINNILKNYYNRALKLTFSTYDLERKVEDLSYVKYARVSFDSGEREISTNYQLGYMIENEGTFYKASKIMGYSGETEPNWNIPLDSLNSYIGGNQIDTKYVTRDGTIYWRCFKRIPNISHLILTNREPTTQYGIGDFVMLPQYPNFIFKCVDIVRESGGKAPDTTDSQLGDFIVDGGIVWVVKDRNDTADTWDSLKQFQLGDVVNSLGPYSLECISYTGSTGTSERINFEERVYNVVGQTTNTLSVHGDKTAYFISGDVIIARYEGGYTTFSVVSSVYDETNTVITVTRYQDGDEEIVDSTKEYLSIEATQRGTKDGSIQWMVVDDINKITYAWNSYVTFEPNVVIIED